MGRVAAAPLAILNLILTLFLTSGAPCSSRAAGERGVLDLVFDLDVAFDVERGAPDVFSDLRPQPNNRQ